MVPRMESTWRGGLFTASDGHASPGKASEAFVQAAGRHGAVLEPYCAVEGFEQSASMRGYFCHAAPAIRGDQLEFIDTESPVVCFESHPKWYKSVSAGVSRNEELVSVVMTCYNDAATVERAIESVLAQTYASLELIVVEDHSDDDSFERIRRAAMHDSRIRLMRSPSNRGTYWCKNYGMMHATGTYVTFHDGDDVSPSHRIQLQVAALHYESDTAAVMTKYQRVGITGVVQFGKTRRFRNGRITFMARREALHERFGYFDSVRAGADDELIERMRAAGARLVTLPECGYYAWHASDSLTTGGDTAIVGVDGAPKESRVRAEYWEGAQAWHAEVRNSGADPRLAFPLLRRPFPIPRQLAPSPDMDPNTPQRVVASMATMPRRTELLRKTVARLTPQVDQLNVYLNDFDEVPDFLRHPKIRVLRSQDHEGDLKDNGKFYPAGDLGDAYHVTVDDDLNYPPDYVARLVLGVERYQRRAVVGFHGVNLAEPMENYLEGREVSHFPRALADDVVVHLLGTGTLAYHTSTLDVALGDFETSGVADLWFAISAKRQDIPMICLNRSSRWLTALDTGADNLFATARADHEGPTRIAISHGPWPRNVVTPGHASLAALVAAGKSPGQIRAEGTRIASAVDVTCASRLKMVVLVNGWNCVDLVETCWDSIMSQATGNFDVEAIFLDDGSSDGTWDRLRTLNRDGAHRLIRIEQNHGPAWARLELLRHVDDPEAVCVLLDMDDRLAPQSLRRVAECYEDNSDCLLTLGNWEGSRGRRNPLDPYGKVAIEDGLYRRIRQFRCPHLRTFRRKLANDLPEARFKDPNGNWLRYCTDVALLLTLLERCSAENIELVREVLYVYTERRAAGTLERFGRPDKAATHEWLASRDHACLEIDA